MSEIEKISIDEQTSIYEDIVMNATEDLLCRMEDCDLTRSDLARRIGKSRSTVSKMLDGDRNMTLRTLVKIAAALGMRPKITFKNIRVSDNRVVSFHLYAENNNQAEQFSAISKTPTRSAFSHG